MNYSTMKNLKEEIISLSERELILGFSLKYNLIEYILIMKISLTLEYHIY